MRMLLLLALALAALSAAAQSPGDLAGRWVLDRLTHTTPPVPGPDLLLPSYALTLEIIELAFTPDGRAEGVLLVAQPDGLERVTLGADYRLDAGRLVFDLDPDPDDAPAGSRLRVVMGAALDGPALLLSDADVGVSMRFVRAPR